jgi:hypothetical protein
MTMPVFSCHAWTAGATPGAIACAKMLSELVPKNWMRVPGAIFAALGVAASGVDAPHAAAITTPTAEVAPTPPRSTARRAIP